MVDCGSGEAKNRFVCPNDRQLALRAKLRTGWSVKTSSTSYQTPLTPLGEDEQKTIIGVIKRAEQLEQTEQERVGKLVERLEQLRRNALGKGPSQCLLCGDTFGMLGAQRIICIDCKRSVCNKCGIEGYINRPNSSSKEQWLCLICAETREIWKKSGAWFFKSLPKYILPDHAGGLTKSRSLRGSRKGRTSYRDDDSSSDEDSKFWTRRERRNSGTESTHGIHDPLPYPQPPVYSHSRQTSSTDSQISKELEALRTYNGSSTLSEIKNWDSDVRIEYNNTDSSVVSRRDSVTSRSLLEWNWNETPRAEEKISPGAISVNSNVFKNLADDTKSVEGTLGTIELSLLYDHDNSTLHCFVHRAKNLIPMDINGLADPFCKLNILPNAKMSTRLRTKTVHKTRNPEFNEKLTFYDIRESDLMKKSLHILVVDDDKYGHDYMGETRIPLAKLWMQNSIYAVKSHPTDLILPLENLRPEQKGPVPNTDLKEWFDDLWSRGQILLSLVYSTKKRALLVTVARCVNLLPMDNNGYSDPFVKLQLRPDPNHRKYKTSVKWKNLNPVFNEEFAFETRPNELSTQSLYITVWDKDYGKSNDYLGGLILGGIGSKGQRLKHWLDMIKYPDHRHEMWHNLTEDQIMD